MEKKWSYNKKEVKQKQQNALTTNVSQSKVRNKTFQLDIILNPKIQNENNKLGKEDWKENWSLNIDVILTKGKS